MKNSKSLSLILGLSACIGSVNAQVSPSHPYTAPHPIYGSFSVTDSNYYNSKQLAQHNEFMVGSHDYPGKPKDMWEIGIKGGLFTIGGDVSSVLLTTPSFGAHIRKSLGHTLSLRLEYMYGIAKGQNWQPSSGYRFIGYENPWFYRYTKNSVLPGGAVWDPINYPGVYYNYKTHVQELSLQVLANIHNIRFYKAQTGVTLYALAGFGVSTWKGRVDAMYRVQGDAESAAYDFSTINSGGYADRKDILKELKDLQDGDYDTPIERDLSKPYSDMFRGNIAPSVSGGLGLAFRLSPRINLAIEDRVIYNGSDLLDGQRWDEKGTLSPDKDIMNYLTVGLNFNIGNKSRRVEPLYWLNSMNYAYGELRRVPEIVLPDADGDGVTDQFDQE